MWKALAFLQKNLIWTIPACMLLGILFGYLYDPSLLKSAILPLTFLMVYPMMVNLNLKEVVSGGDTRVQVVTQALNFLVIPFLGFFIGRYFFPAPEQQLIVLGLLLTGLLPTSGMTISWTGFAKGNVSAAIKMTVIGLILGSLATPFYLKWLMGTVIEIPLADIFQQIVLIVFIPMVAGYATQRFIIWKFGKEQYQKVYKPRFPALSTLGVLGIVFTAMALKAKTITADPTILLQLLLPLVLIYGLNFGLSTIVGKLLFKRNDAIALVYGTVMRNLSIALAIAMTAFGQQGSEIALIIAVAYIIQVQAAAWYVNLTDRIFGPASAAVPQAATQATVPQATLSDTAGSDVAVRQAAVPQAVALDAAAFQAAVLQAAALQAATFQAAALQAATLQAALRQATTPQTAAPDVVVSVTASPDTVVPQTAAPKTS